MDMPMRALRLPSGTVYLKLDQPAEASAASNAASADSASAQAPSVAAAAGAAAPKLIPLAGVQIAAGHSAATTDANGRFVLRDLPAGDLMVTLVAIQPMPPELHLPAATVRLPMDSIQINNAEIVITSPQLLPYLTLTPPGFQASAEAP